MLEDELLKLRFLCGSSNALAQIYRKHADRLLALAVVLLKDVNAAEDVLYSGTVAAAREAAVLGIPSFALSQAFSSATRQEPYWKTPVEHAPGIISRVLKEGIVPRYVWDEGSKADHHCHANNYASIAAQIMGGDDSLITII